MDNFLYLPDIVAKQKHSIKRGPFGSALKKQFFVKKGFKVYEQKNAINNDFTIGEYYIDEVKFNELIAFKLSPGDVIISCSGTIGKIAIAPQNISQGIINQALLKITLNNDVILTSYFKYWFESYVLGGELTAIGAAIKNIVSVKDLKLIPIPVPDIDIQEIIVSKLDDVFLKIDKSIVLLEENLNHSQALMGSILDEVFTNLENTSEVVKISKIADIKGGKRLPKGEQLQNTKTDYPYIRVTDFNDNGSIDVNDLKYMTKEIQSKISRYIITSDDLYISIAGTIGKTGIIPKELDGANLTENAARFVYKDKKGISNKFVYYYTKSDKFKAFVSEATKQVAQPKLALARLNEIELALPSITEQEKAVAKFIEMEKALSKMEKEIQIKLYNMKALKNSLLDQAFKGEL